MKNGALGIIMVSTLQELTAMPSPAAGGGGRGASINGPTFQVVKFQSARPPAVPVITAGLGLTSAIFQGERLTAAQVLEGVAANTKLDSFELNPEKKLTLQIAVTSERSRAHNVYAMLGGRKPAGASQAE